MLVPTPRGDARIHVYAAARPRAWIVLGHGAGRGTDTHDLAAIAAALPAEGSTVVLVDQPWVVAGGRGGRPAAVLDDAWLAVLAALRDGTSAGLPLVVGGRSTGARVACRTAAATGADALLLLGFPLRAPTAKDPVAATQVRLAEWARVGDRPVVLVQGERDAFGAPEAVVAAVAAVGLPAPHLVAVPGADHALVSRTADVAGLVVDAARAAVALSLGGPAGSPRGA